MVGMATWQGLAVLGLGGGGLCQGWVAGLCLGGGGGLCHTAETHLQQVLHGCHGLMPLLWLSLTHVDRQWSVDPWVQCFIVPHSGLSGMDGACRSILSGVVGAHSSSLRSVAGLTVGLLPRYAH